MGRGRKGVPEPDQESDKRIFPSRFEDPANERPVVVPGAITTPEVRGSVREAVEVHQGQVLFCDAAGELEDAARPVRPGLQEDDGGGQLDSIGVGSTPSIGAHLLPNRPQPHFHPGMVQTQTFTNERPRF